MRHHRHRHSEQADRGHLYDILSVVLLAVLAYGAWKFVPPLKTRWDIDQATKVYVDRLNRQTRQAEISSKLYDQLDTAGVDLDDVEIEVDYDANKPAGRITAPVLRWVEVTVYYTPVVRHLGGSVTELEVSLSRRRVWDDSW